MAGLFAGLSPQLVDEAFVTDLDERFQAGQLLSSQGVGTIHLQLSILTKVSANGRLISMLADSVS